MAKEAAPDQIPTGFKLRYTLRGHSDVICGIAWSPDGRTLASGGNDGIIRLWDAATGQQRLLLKRRSETISRVDWSPDGQTLASAGNDSVVRLWDTTTGQQSRALKGHSEAVNSVDWSPDGKTLVSGSNDKTVLRWDTADGRWYRMIEAHFEPVLDVAWSPDGQTLASAGRDGKIRLWGANVRQLHCLTQNMPVLSIAWSPDGQKIASAGVNGIVRLWDAKTGALILTLEGHTSAAKSIAFSFDGRLLASKSLDGTVRLWRCDTGENVSVLSEPATIYWPPSLAFHPSAPVLATLGEKDRVIRIWDLDFYAILNTTPPARGISYTNAKVVLIGETGVGKTGLGLRLAEGVWRPTESTHGMNVWTLYSEPEREVMLWDFAGQDEYKLVHQLFLNETNVALLLYDPTKSNDTFPGTDYWEKALRNAASGDVQKILVAARVDVGGVRLTDEDIAAFCKAHGYDAHFATSAETGEGCDALRDAIMAAIPWDSLPRTSSPEVFKRIKDFLAAVRQGNRVLVREPDLLAEFNARAGEAERPTEAEFRTVIGHVETAGLIKRLSFGDFVLLKPELLNAYASDIVDAARAHAHGLGAVRKSDVLAGSIRLKDEGGLKETDRVFLLHATVELFLRLGLALEQDGNLVFPSKFNRRMPPLEEDPVVEVEFSFEGPVENLYTTLVVKLYYGGVFTLKKLWKNAAEFLNARGHVCGFQLQHEGEGRGTLRVFYAEGVRDDDRALFLKIVADHFRDKRVEVRRERVYRCPACREVVQERSAVRRAMERGKDKIFCQDCGGTIQLVDALETLYRDGQKFLAQIAEMESRAEASMERVGGLVAAAAELRTEDFRQWIGGAEVATVAIVFTDVVDSTSLNVGMGDDPWRREREAHFARARALVKRGRGYLVKTIGDSVMAAFHDAGAALDFALALQRDTGSPAVQIRAGIHIGAMEIAPGDAFGQQVSMAARVEAKAAEGGTWLSAKVKEDIDALRAERHRRLKWVEHPGEELKGFPGRFTLWSVEE